jgi:hypothetical protein
MPKNWPAPPRVVARSRPRSPARPWYRQSSRLALAAAVSFFLIGYLALASLFPSGQSRSGPAIPPVIGHRDKIIPLQIERTPAGHRAGSSGVWKDGTIRIRVEYLGK